LQTRRLYSDAVDAVLARVSGGGTAAWYLPDRQGSIRDIESYAGTADLDHLDYDGWGNATESNAGNGDRYKWTGREWDAPVLLQYNRARFYDPKAGRWLSQDPLGFAAGDSNLYRYVKDAPTNGMDPSGLWDPQGLRYAIRQKGGGAYLDWLASRGGAIEPMGRWSSTWNDLGVWERSTRNFVGGSAQTSSTPVVYINSSRDNNAAADQFIGVFTTADYTSWGRRWTGFKADYDAYAAERRRAEYFAEKARVAELAEQPPSPARDAALQKVTAERQAALDAMSANLMDALRRERAFQDRLSGKSDYVGALNELAPPDPLWEGFTGLLGGMFHEAAQPFLICYDLGQAIGFGVSNLAGWNPVMPAWVSDVGKATASSPNSAGGSIFLEHTGRQALNLLLPKAASGLGRAWRYLRGARSNAGVVAPGRGLTVREVGGPRGDQFARHQASPGIPESATITQLWENSWRPGVQGVTIEGSFELGDLFHLSMRNGNIEFLLTAEVIEGRTVNRLYSGTAGRVFAPENARIIAHVHPLERLPGGGLAVQTRPSLGDRAGLNDYYRSLLQRDPYATQPSELIIWGPGPNHYTRFLPQRNVRP
jgi:RHS repeat-associated protein